MAPSRIGPYRIERQLGSGGMGQVYRAFDERLKRRVAIKLLRSEIVDKPGFRERLRREAQAVARLSHPAIVQIYDMVETDRGECIVMEHVAGDSLSEIIADGSLELERVLRLGREIAEGLAAAHDRGLVHRDLKTENVLVTPDDHAKILDFGIAKRLRVEEPENQQLTVAGALVGTFRAMSPEQANQRPVDLRSDLFAFGTMLYEMLSGDNPFVAENALSTMVRITVHQQRPLSELNPAVPPELSALVDRLLAKDPALRPGSAHEVATSLERILLLSSGLSRLENLESLDRLIDELASSGFVAQAIALLRSVDLEESQGAAMEAKLARRVAQRPASRPTRGSEPRAAYDDPTLAQPRHVSAAEQSQIATLSGTVPLFSQFTNEELLAIMRGLRVRRYQGGQVLFSEGEPGDSLLVLASGAVRVYVKNVSGGQTEIRKLEQGSFFGEISLLSGAPRSATVIAATACEVLILDRPTVARITESHPDVRETLRKIYRERAGSEVERRARAEPTPPI